MAELNRLAIKNNMRLDLVLASTALGWGRGQYSHPTVRIPQKIPPKKGRRRPCDKQACCKRATDFAETPKCSWFRESPEPACRAFQGVGCVLNHC